MILTLTQAQNIVKNNNAFETSSFMLRDIRIHNFGYRLPSYMDFENPVPGSGLKAHEMRGLTFVEYPDGNVTRHLMLRKFHALNQTAGFMLKDIVNKKIVSCSEKLDGSIVRFIPIENKIFARTKSSFHGAHARLAGKLLDENINLQNFLKSAHDVGLAPIFELISPDYKIVVPYQEETLRLIQMRNEATGGYVDIANNELVEEFGIRTSLVNGIDTIEDIIKLQSTEKGIEGWVVVFDDGTLMKCKTSWYDDFHDFFFERNHTDKKMINMVVNETMDDALASMSADDPVRPKAEEAYDLISAHINDISGQIQKAIAPVMETPNPDMKQFISSHKGDSMLGLYMQALKNPNSQNILNLAKGTLNQACKKEDEASKFLNRLRNKEATSSPRL